MGTRVTAIENIPPTVAAPTFSPPGGTYCALTVTISTATAGATIRYTLDGSTPTETKRDSGYLGRDRQLKDAQGCSTRGSLLDETPREELAVVVQAGLPATILVSSAAFALADGKGKVLGPGITQIPVVERNRSKRRQRIRHGVGDRARCRGGSGEAREPERDSLVH